jgi:hypothetical protein
MEEKKITNNKKILFKIYFIILTFIHMCIHCLGYLSLPLLPGRTCSTLLFSDFVEEKNIRDNKKDIAFLLVCDKDNYTERFLALLPCTCVLQPTWVHLCQTSSLLPIPIVASASLRLLYLLLYSEYTHQNTFKF